MNKRYQQEILDYCAERALLCDDSYIKECESCKNLSVYVEPFDVSYRNLGATVHIMDLCVHCKYELIETMDDDWNMYYAGLL